MCIIFYMNDNSNLPLPELLVEKRSGNTEKFSTEKLLKGISRSGTPFLIAKDVSESLTDKFMIISKLKDEKVGVL